MSSGFQVICVLVGENNVPGLGRSGSPASAQEALNIPLDRSLAFLERLDLFSQGLELFTGLCHPGSMEREAQENQSKQYSEQSLCHGSSLMLKTGRAAPRGAPALSPFAVPPFIGRTFWPAEL